MRNVGFSYESMGLWHIKAHLDSGVNVVRLLINERRD